MPDPNLPNSPETGLTSSRYPTGMGEDREIIVDGETHLIRATGFLIYVVKVYPHLGSAEDIGIFGNAARAFLNNTGLRNVFEELAHDPEHEELFREALQINIRRDAFSSRDALVISRLYDVLAPKVTSYVKENSITKPGTTIPVEPADLCRAM